MAELQEILSMGQSRISTHLSQLKQAGMVEDRKQGKNSLYRLRTGNWSTCCIPRRSEIPEAKDDAQSAATRARKTPRQGARLFR